MGKKPCMKVLDPNKSDKTLDATTFQQFRSNRIKSTFSKEKQDYHIIRPEVLVIVYARGIMNPVFKSHPTTGIARMNRNTVELGHLYARQRYESMRYLIVAPTAADLNVILTCRVTTRARVRT
ncbi:hypothetical protein M0804_007733 [Polistes exclamans]|nr:hypothetical protein M0804_007733 [Polistes exclamans]